MVNIGNIMKGIGIFFIGYFFIIISDYTIPPIIDTMQTIYASTALEQIIWFGVILIWILLAVVAPSLYILTGIKEPMEGPGPLKVIFGVLLFVFSMALTVKGWYMIPTFVEIGTNTFIQGLFWVGFIAVWIEIALLTPAYLIIEGMKK